MNKFQFEKNGFDLIRYWAAISVMLLHFTGYALMIGNNDKAALWKLRQVASFFPGVVVFFALSGYLITASRERIQSEKVFFKKRIMRLYPELWLCTIVNMVILFILVPEMLDGSIVIWGLTQIAGFANTPDCLTEFATGSVNGTLWTICVEIQLYIVLGMGYKIFKRLKNWQWYIVLAGCAFANVFFDFVARNMEGVVLKIIERMFLPYFLWFMIGVFCYFRKEWVYKHRWMVVWLLCVYLIFYLLPVEIPGYYKNIVVGILCPFIVVMGGYCLPPIRIRKDITYGLFLYHWIVLNILIHFKLLQTKHWLICMILFLVMSGFFAWGSNCICNKLIQIKLAGGKEQK